MALKKLLADLSIISKLGTNPGIDDGLSEEQLKAKFDEAANIIKDYLNNYLILEIENKVVVESLPVSGGDMTGGIRMNGNPITGLSVPAENSQAANKEYVDLMLPKSGGEMNGALGMGWNKINGLAAPEDSADAATKGYVDGKRFTATATITTTWSGNAAPYTQAVSVSGILATDTPHIMPVYSTTNSTAISQKEAWACVSKAETSDGTITFTCFEDKPTTDIPIQIEVMR